MLFRSFFDENLAHMSYLVGCQRTGEAIVIDPARNILQYEEAAKKEGLRITAATETHIHADFLSGAREMAKYFDATLYLSDEGDADWKYQYVDDLKHVLVKEGSTFKIGNIQFEVLHTPGHTPESISFILTDFGGGASEPMGIFTGDFVFVGDIGRPDLLEKAAGVIGTADSGAKAMFQSLKKFKALPDYLQVWPAHGAGSACGKALGAVPMTTVGYEKRFNWAMRIEDEATFVRALLDGQPEPPKYFAMMKKLNKVGPDYVKKDDLPVIQTLEQLKEMTNERTIIIDTRLAVEFAKGHLEGNINIPFNKSFTNWAGWFVSYDQEMILIIEEEQGEQIRKALAAIGLDNVKAIVPPTVILSSDNLETADEITVHQLKELLNNEDYYLIDVRNLTEYEAGNIEGAHHIMLGTIPNRLNEIPTDKTLLMQCQSGARSAMALSILQAKGYKNIKNVKGGYLAWKRDRLETVNA
ncbi:MAG: rhodanese-like domain-containing protein [Bacillaceae bacterium]